MKKVALVITVALGLISCGSGSGSDSGIPDVIQTPLTSDVNVAASINGATVTTTFNSNTSSNINDGDDTTTWISDPDVSLVIDFSSVNEVKKITIRKVSSATAGGSNPDILVELSEDGVTYKSSDITTITGGDLSCNSSGFSSELLVCEMNVFSARFLRLTSKNGKSFEFKEVEVISNK